MNHIFKYIIHVGDATSQWVNTVFLLGDPNESISGRAYRMNHHFVWGIIEKVINWLLSPFEQNHCQKAYDADYDRAARLLRGL